MVAGVAGSVERDFQTKEAFLCEREPIKRERLDM